ncbi:MAG: DUF302 domain-containing protein [Solirubrobacterales bacterium]
MTEYGFVRELDIDFQSAVDMVRARLADAGFGILMDIDVGQKFHEKLGADIGNYLILGACDPVSACKAIFAEPNIGVMLPCNVIVYECSGKVIVAAIRPTMAMQMIDNLDLHRVARDVERRLKEVIDSLEPVEATAR